VIAIFNAPNMIFGKPRFQRESSQCCGQAIGDLQSWDRAMLPDNHPGEAGRRESRHVQAMLALV
jgi:hypothetical protein